MTNSTQDRKSFSLKELDWRRYVVYIGFVLVFIVFSVTLYSSGFLTSNNLLNIVRQTTMISVMAVALTFVIAAAEIDLSVGSVAGLASVTTALAVSSLGLVPGILAGLLTGLLVGCSDVDYRNSPRTRFERHL
jgi:ribose transport system permease protein